MLDLGKPVDLRSPYKHSLRLVGPGGDGGFWAMLWLSIRIALGAPIGDALWDRYAKD